MDLLARFSGARSVVLTQVRALEARFQRTTTRERALVAGLVMAALIYALFLVVGWRDTAREAYIDAMADQSLARLAQSAARRANADGSAVRAVRDMKSWGFIASNVAIAQVQLEQRLLASATEAGLTNVRIATNPTIETIGPTVWLGAEIRADLRWRATFDFVDEVAQWPEGFRITQFKYDVSTLPMFNLANPGTMPASGSVLIGIAAPVILPADQLVAASAAAPRIAR